MTNASDVVGTWAIVANTPRGQQNVSMSIVPDGDRFTGSVKGDFGEIDVTDGQIEDGPVLRWTMKLRSPLPLTVKCQAELAGDDLTGKITAFGLGSFPLTGRREA